MEKQLRLSKKANAIIQQHDSILASKRDAEIFFGALMNPQGPNQKLRDAAERYKSFIQEHR
jgi:uncharacterized protein (DUF1778 family)